MTELALQFVATYLLHSTVLVGAALVLDRLARPRAPEVRELILRAALFGSVLTAVVATVGLHAPGSPLWRESAADLSTEVDSAKAGAASISLGEVGFEPVTVARDDSAGRAIVAAHAAGAESPIATNARREFAIPRLADDVGLALVAAWLSIGVLALVRLCFAVRLQRALAQRLPAIDMAPAERSLARWFGLEHVGLVLDERAGSPYVAADRVVALPRWAMSLGFDERRALLAHEFAHLARRDPAWLVAIDALRRALWFQPLARLAQSRLDALAELTCDARAAHALGEGRSLARCLATCAEHATNRHVPRFVPAMARRPSLFCPVSNACSRMSR